MVDNYIYLVLQKFTFELMLQAPVTTKKTSIKLKVKLVLMYYNSFSKLSTTNFLIQCHYIVKRKSDEN